MTAAWLNAQHHGRSVCDLAAYEYAMSVGGPIDLIQAGPFIERYLMGALVAHIHEGDFPLRTVEYQRELFLGFSILRIEREKLRGGADSNA